MSRETGDRQAALRYAKQLAEMVPGNPNLSRLITELEAP
jgi:Tfp pilus assembly protein PilF